MSCLTVLSNRVYAQTAPIITYTNSPQSATNTYTVNTTITSLTPKNTGGAVSTGALAAFATIPGPNDATGTTGGGTGQPYGLAYDPTTGDIVTDDFGGGYVYVYSPSGTLLHTYTTSISTFGPKDIVVDASGNIYVANGLGADVVKITPAGVTSTITSSSTAMNQPDGMAVDASGNVYVADQGSDVIYKIASGATTATVYASGFTNLYGVTINSSGQVYASTYTNGSTPSGLYTVSSGSTTGGTLLYATTVASGSSFRNISHDAAGNIYVADEGVNTIVKVTPAGVASTFVTGLNQPRATAYDVFGNMYIANSNGFNIEESPVSNYSINIPLPTGMSFNTSTGVISGTPTVTSPTTVYTIAGHNQYGTGYTTATITVYPTGPSASGGSTCGTGVVTLSASGGTPSGGTYNWYTASTGGSSIATGATYTPTVSATTTYYVDYTQGSVTCAARTAVTATYNNTPVLASPPTTAGDYLSYSFNSSLTDITSGGSNNGTAQGGSLSAVDDQYGVAGNAFGLSRASSQYISTSVSANSPTTFSISAWFNTTSTVGGYIVGFGSSKTGNSGTVDRLIYMGTDNKIYFGTKLSNTTNTVIASRNTYNDGNWHHVVATFSSTNGSNMYIDGALAATNPALNSAATISNGYWRIGYDAITGNWTNAPSSSANTYFNGSLNDIAVTNTELTPAGVNVLYGAGGTSFCSGNTISLTANTVAGATYAWTGPSGSGFTSSSQNPTVPAANAIAGTYVLVVSIGSCSYTINVTEPSNYLTYTWSGAANTSTPTTAGNWDYLPPFSSTSNLVIPTGLAHYPVLTANESVYGLTLGTTASLGLGGFTMSVGCNIVNNATTSATSGILYGSSNNSGITFNGTVAAQSYTGTNNTNTASLGNLTVNNTASGTVTINSGPVDIYNVLTMTKGNLTVGSSPATLTLKCSATQTASVAAIPAASVISGLVNVERFLTGGASALYRGYRLLSSPVNAVSATSSGTGANYINFSYLNASTSFNGGAIYGAFTGGTGSGFSIVNPNPTVYIYDEGLYPTTATRNTTFISGKNVGLTSISGTSVGWKYSVTSANSSCVATLSTNSGTNSVPVGNGYSIFFIGSSNPSVRTTGTTSTPPDNATITNIGYLNQQNVQVYPLFTQAAGNLSYNNYNNCPLLYTNTLYTWRGFNMVGNPYASAIDLHQVYLDNVQTVPYVNFYEWKNTTNSYLAYNGSTGGTQGTGASEYIASGQGFFVQATATGQTLIFKEDQKVSFATAGAPTNFLDAPGGQTASFNRSINTSNPVTRAIQNTSGSELAGLHLMLKKDSNTFRETGIYFSNKWSDAYDINDALDLDGSSLAVYMSSITADGVRTGINSLADYTKGKRVKLYVKATTDGLYYLALEDIQNIDTALFNVFLIDNHSKVSLDLIKFRKYPFNIVNADTSTYGTNRFLLVIERKQLPAYQLVSLTAKKVSNGVLLTWKTNNEGNYTGFGIQKQEGSSTQYQTLYNVQSDGNGTYTYVDTNPVTGNNTYRLMQNNIDSLISYSNPLNILYDVNSSWGVLSVYPNPAHESITVNFNSTTTGTDTYKSIIYDAMGRMVMRQSVSGNSWTQDVSQLKPGAYIIEVSGSNGSTVGNSKFIKTL